MHLTKKEFERQQFCSLPPPDVVRCDGGHLFTMRPEKFHHGLADRLGSLALHLSDQQEIRLAFDQADNGLLVVLADDGIDFPVANPAPRFDDGQT